MLLTHLRLELIGLAAMLNLEDLDCLAFYGSIRLAPGISKFYYRHMQSLLCSMKAPLPSQCKAD